MSLYTPEGKPAGSIDRIMLSSQWVHKLNEEKSPTRPPIISAGMGKPTFPISQFAAQAGIVYWGQASDKTQQARHLLTATGRKNIDAVAHNRIAKILAAIGYGDPMGDFEARAKIAGAFTRWYRQTIEPQHVLFTVGGAGALNSIFAVINKRIPGGYIVTPFPHYGLYIGSQRQNKLYPMHLLKESGYHLTADVLDKSLKKATEEAAREGRRVSAFLLCDPNNPLGTTIGKEELAKIAAVLKKYPDIFIILDEAYAEMRLAGEPTLSLLSSAPELRDRIILMRSATKALSAAGERMAVTITFNSEMMADLLEANVNVYGHAPRSSQFIFAEAMDKLDPIELGNLRRYYKPQVDYVTARLLRMGAAMPDPNYQPDGAFYVLADFSDLMGQEIKEASRALGKTGKITTDEDLIYCLLFDNGVLVAPLSYFGTSNRNGFVRITCSGGLQELEELLDRLEKRLLIARREKQANIEKQLKPILEQLDHFDRPKAAKFRELISQNLAYQTASTEINAKTLKRSNGELYKILVAAKVALAKYSPTMQHAAATKIQSVFRGHQDRLKCQKLRNRKDDAWHAWVESKAIPEKRKMELRNWSASERQALLPRSAKLKEEKPASSLLPVDSTTMQLRSRL